MKNIILLFALSIFSLSVCRSQELNINWIEVKGGLFTIANKESSKEITLSNFFMSATEVTFDQYDYYCKESGANLPDDNGWGRGKRPVIKVSWDDAMRFCKWLSKKIGSKVRLPNEVEWEYAAIGGSETKGYTYSGSNNWKDVSCSEGNSGNKTQHVGSKKSNELGLYDMSGNVWEWCSDWSVDDRKSTKRNEKHALRGNSFDNPASDPRLPAIRLEGDSRHYNIGFRIVMTK